MAIANRLDITSKPDDEDMSEEQYAKNLEAAAMIRGWLAEDGPDETELWERFKAGLEEAHESSRKLFSD